MVVPQFTSRIAALLGVTLALAVAIPCSAARYALVVGNDKYQYVNPLSNAQSDAKAVSELLKAAGINVTLALNLDQKAFKATLRNFKGRLAGGDEAIFYFAGHGLEIGGTNFLLPVDIENTESEDQVRDESIGLQRILADMEDQHVRLSVAIIDACRENPFKHSSRTVARRGLGPTQAATGQMIIYSAGAGQSALDSLGVSDRDAHSVFTRTLLKHLPRPGIPIDQLVRAIRDDVAQLAQSVGHEQVPALYDQTVGVFYIYPPDAAAPSTARQSQANPPAPQSLALERSGAQGAEDQLWRLIEQSADPRDYEDYLKQYPGGQYVALAKKKLRLLANVSAPSRANETTQTRAPEDFRPGQVFKDCEQCPDMVVVPAGSVQMGSKRFTKEKFGNEGPLHDIRIPKPFAISKFSITFDQWDLCVQEGACEHAAMDYGWGRGMRPAIDVNWNDAQSYVRWLAGKTGRRYRLLSEAEWEYAACAGTITARYWGDTVGSNHANCDGCGSRWDNKQTAPSGSFEPNPFGLYDMLGNAWQWTEDCWNGSYLGAPTTGSAWTSGDCKKRVIRGGSWYTKPIYARTSSRLGQAAGDRTKEIGFRVGRSLE